MKYNGLELVEAEGKDYQLGPIPKHMLVWDNGSPYERDVLGFFRGFWVAADIWGKGVGQWLHAAEIPKASKTIVDIACEIRNKTGFFPFVILPKNVTLTPKDYVIGIREEANSFYISWYISQLKRKEFTVIVHPDCYDTTKAMMRELVECTGERPKVIFFEEDK